MSGPRRQRHPYALMKPQTITITTARTAAAARAGRGVANYAPTNLFRLLHNILPTAGDDHPAG